MSRDTKFIMRRKRPMPENDPMSALCEFIDDALARGQSWVLATPDEFMSLHQRLHDDLRASLAPETREAEVQAAQDAYDASLPDDNGLLQPSLEGARHVLDAGLLAMALDHVDEVDHEWGVVGRGRKVDRIVAEYNRLRATPNGPTFDAMLAADQE